MEFPDLESLRRAARAVRFRNVKKDETEAEYREALAKYFDSQDYNMAKMVRAKTLEEDLTTDVDNKLDMLLRKMSHNLDKQHPVKQ